MQLGFLGAGWIGRHRLAALVESGIATVTAIADVAPENRRAAAALAPGATMLTSAEELLATELDGIVIATPSALHAEHAIAALERGRAVFCQKPLGRTVEETRRVVDTARAVDRLLAVDFSYRHVEAVRQLRSLIRGGTLGDVFTADLVFHNAYGPDKAWYYDPRLSGGGCVVDLGIHLVDLALWVLADRRVTGVTSRLFAGGAPLDAHADDAVEDYAVAQLDFEGGATVRLACSWNLSAGCDAVIEASFFGTRGGAVLRNVDGSFYDFIGERFDGTRRERLTGPPDEWGGRALVAWARRLAEDRSFDPAAERLVDIAAVIDAIYAPRPSEVALCVYS